MRPQLKPVLPGQQLCWVNISYSWFLGKLPCPSMERDTFGECFTSRQQTVGGDGEMWAACPCVHWVVSWKGNNPHKATHSMVVRVGQRRLSFLTPLLAFDGAVNPSLS